MRNAALLAAVSFVFVGCATMDVPQAYRGRMFDRSGPLTIAKTGQGFIGPVLNPGTYSVGYYNEVMTVDCSTVTQHDPLTVLTKDGVQFGLDMYVRFSANCSDESVREMLTTLTPDKDTSITTRKLFETYVRPTIQAVVREAAKRGLGFFDDGSAPRSVAASLAAAQAMPFARGDITIDAVPTAPEIDHALTKLEEMAKQRGHAIGTASALPVSIERIGNWIKGLEAHGVMLVPLTTAMLKSKSG